MNLRQVRNERRDAVLEGRFITHVLEKEAVDINKDIGQRVAGFQSSFWKERTFTVRENTLTYAHKRGHRFVDMHSRKTKKGVRRKRNYTVHNRPLYGHANAIVKELTVGLTDAVYASFKPDL